MSRYWHAEWWAANENISWYMKNFITGNKRIALIFPAGESAEHHFHRPPELSQLQRGNVSAVAVRPGAVDHKEGIRRPCGHSLGGDLAVREMLRARR